MRLYIATTWDGIAISPDESASLSLSASDDALVVTVDAPWHGDPAPIGPAGPTWALWEHEVVELFVLGSNGHYLELELGPHGHHLVLQLSGRRQVAARELPLDY